MLHNPARATDAARGTARARAAALYMNAAPARRIVEAWTSALVGRGWQARSGMPDRSTAGRLNATFEALANPLLPLVARCLVRDGEAFVHICTGDDGIAPVVLDPAQVDAALSRPLDDGARIEQGIELDRDGRVIAYHVLRDLPGAVWTSAETLRIPAADMLHVFDRLFPGQVRGLSWLAPVLLKLSDRDALSDALLMQAKVGALMTGFLRDPEGGTAGFAGEGGAAGALEVTLEPGAMRILPPGADVTFSPQPQGLRDAVAFLAATDREIAAGSGLTYEQLTGDLGAANYSSARVGLLDFRRRAEALQRHLIEGQFLRPLWRRWIDVQTLAGLIPADPLSQADHRAVRFIGPGFDWIDPESQVAAEVLAMQNGLKSREEIVAARGRDLDELDAEIARDGARRQVEASA